MPFLSHRSFGVVLTLVACLAAAAPSDAQQGWTGVINDVSEPIAESEWLGVAAVGADGFGHVRAIWSERVGDGLQSVILTARRAADTGTWSEPVEAFRTSLAGGVVCNQLLVDFAGNATASCAANSDTQGFTFALRYAVATDSWMAEEIESGIGLPLPHLAMDAAGNTYVAWSSTTIRLRRHNASTETWSPVVELPVVGVRPKIGADAGGNLFVTWLTSDSVQTIINGAHYEAAIGRWSGVARMPVPSHFVGSIEVGVDRTGHAMIVWAQWTTLAIPSVVRAARYTAASNSWGPVIDLSAGAAEFTNPKLAMDAEGNALAVWRARYSGFHRIEAAAFNAGTGTWGGVIDVSAPGLILDGPEIASDPGGNVTIAWHAVAGSESVLRVARLKKTTGTLEAPFDLAIVDPDISRAKLTADRVGSVTVLWHQQIGMERLVQATRWEATPPAPDITSAVAGSGALRLHVVPPETAEPDFAPTNYEYSLDDGATWIPRTPPSTMSPLDIVGLAGGATHQVRVRAVNQAGPGVASTVFPVSLPVAPQSPTNLAATSIVGNRVNVRWNPPSEGTPVQGYVVEGGVHPGETLVMLPTGSTAPTFSFTAPSGVFVVRVRAYAGASWSSPSNEIQIHVNVPAPPSAPAHLLGLVNGTTVALSWMNTAEGGAPTSLWLNVSGAAAGTLPLPTAESISFAGVPPGTYTLSISAANSAGVSPPSNAVTLTFPGPCSGAPESPRNVVAVASGRTVHVAWDAPATGPAVTGYTVLVTGTYDANLETSERSLSGAATPGSYTLRVVATNACGTSAPTSPHTATVF